MLMPRFSVSRYGIVSFCFVSFSNGIVSYFYLTFSGMYSFTVAFCCGGGCGFLVVMMLGVLLFVEECGC